MGHRHEETYHLDREAAEAAQKVTGTPGYSEVYARPGRVSLQTEEAFLRRACRRLGLKD